MYENYRSPDELYHVGVKGRSGRYPLGSGKRPYQMLEGINGIKTSKLEKAMEFTSSANKNISALRNIAKPNKKIRKIDLSKYSDKELSDTIRRMNLEKAYRDLTYQPTKIELGKTHVNNILNATSGALTVGTSAIGLAIAIQKLRDK